VDHLPGGDVPRPRQEPTEGYSVPGIGWFVPIGSCSTPGLCRMESAVSEYGEPETIPLLGQPLPWRAGARVGWFVITTPLYTFACAIRRHLVRGSPELASVRAPLNPCSPRIEGQSHLVGFYRHPSIAGVGLDAGWRANLDAPTPIPSCQREGYTLCRSSSYPKMV